MIINDLFHAKKSTLAEFAPGGGGDDDYQDPYGAPKPEHYDRSIDFFGQFEADHFDEEDMNDATGEFRGYWLDRDAPNGRTQIAYFKFDNPRRTGSDDPGVGWYYEPESDGNSNITSAEPSVDKSNDHKQQELSMIKAFLKSGQKPNPGSQIYNLMKRHGMAEGAGNIGAQIKAAYQKIHDQGDDAIEFAYYDSPIFAQYWDEYEGDLDSIIAEVEPSELQIILDELQSAAEEQGVAEGQTPEQEIERLKLRQNAEHGGASLKRQAATQARIRDLEKQIKDKKGMAEGKHKCTCHPGDADPDCPVHGLEPMEVGDALDIKEVSDKTLTNYLTKVDADSQKHDKDPTKRSAEKRNRSVAGFSKAFNKLDARKPDGSVAEDNAGVPVHRIGLTVTDPNHPMVSKRGETIQKTVRVPGTDREKAINSAIAHYRRKGYRVHDYHYIGTVDEGRFVKGPGGVPLDRQGNPIVPKEKASAPIRMRKWLVTHDGSHGEGGKMIIDAPNSETAWELANEYDLDIIDIKPVKGVAEAIVKPVTPAAKKYHEQHKWILNGNVLGAAKHHYEMIAKLNKQGNKKGVAEGPVTKKPQSYNDPDWIKKLPKDQLDALGGKRYSKDKKPVSEVSLGDYRKKAMMSKAMAQTDRFFGRDDAAKAAAADQTIAKREQGLARADARIKPYTPPQHDAEKYQRDLTAKYPNIDELVRQAELRRDPNYDRAEGNAYYAGREAEQNYQRLRQIQRVIQGLNESLDRSHLP